MKIYGKGSVTRLEKKPKARCRKWRIRVSTEQGLISKRFTGTYSQALEDRDSFVDGLKEIVLNPKSFKTYADSWIEYRETSGEYATRTINKYKDSLKPIILHVGHMKVSDIKQTTMKEVYTALRKGETPSGIPYSGTTMNQVHTILNMVFESAVSDGLMTRNPLEKIDTPKIDTEEKKSLSLDAFCRFTKQLDTEPLTGHTIGLILAVMVGGREGEAVAFRWLNYDGMNLIVSNGTEPDGELKAPKTEKSKRILPLTQYVRDKLDQWYKIQVAEFSKLGIEHSEETRIVTYSGRGITPGALGKWWRRNRGKKYNLEGYTFHELRHTFTTRLVHSGANHKTVQDLLGQKLDAKLLDRYTHSDNEQNRLAMESLERVLLEVVG